MGNLIGHHNVAYSLPGGIAPPFNVENHFSIIFGAGTQEQYLNGGRLCLKHDR